jgi:hypothetical protein
MTSSFAGDQQKDDLAACRRRAGLWRIRPAGACRGGADYVDIGRRCGSGAIAAALRLSEGDFLHTFKYDFVMTKVIERLSPEEIADARKRRLEAMHLQVIEGNPFDEEDITMFEMFEREGWDHERCLDYILARAREPAK